MKNKMIAGALAALIAWLALFCAGCGGSGAPDIDTVDLIGKMSEVCELPEMLTISTGDSREQKGLAAISDMDIGKVAQYSLMYSADGSAYELAVIRLKDESDVKAMEESLKKHIDSRVQQYKYYDSTQVSRAESAIVAVHGQYAALIMCDNSAEAREVFDKALG